MVEMRVEIGELFGQPEELLDRERARALVRWLFEELNLGRMRAAWRAPDGNWHPDRVVKQGILLAFRVGVLEVVTSEPYLTSDKDTLPLRSLDPIARNLRLVPGGSSMREGTYIGRNVTCMPPMYINVGAFVDDDTMIDSHVLVGSCAQIGRRVHLSAGAQIGGVLEPIGSLPVVVEDDVLVGGNTGLYDGTIIRRQAVIGAGTILTRSVRVYDLVRQQVLSAPPGGSLEIPENAVVVPGSRALGGSFAEAHGLQVATPVIIKYRDQKTASHTALEEALR